jgi:[methyl-Co(III) methanol-specific corrinoid protein]:coenzyme M methyltransferase
MEQTGHTWPEAHRDAAQMAGLARAMTEATGFDNFGVPFCMTVEAEALGCRVDDGSRAVQPHVTSEPLQRPADVNTLRPFDPQRDGRLPVVLEALARLREKGDGQSRNCGLRIANCELTGLRTLDNPQFAIRNPQFRPQSAIRNPQFAIRRLLLGNLVGPLSLAASVAEASLFLRWMRRDTASVHALLEFLTENLLTFGRAQVAAGADALTVADPTACGDILGGAWFAEFAAPYLQRLLTGLRATGVPVILHICGCVRPIAPALAELSAGAVSVDAVTSIHDLQGLPPDRLRMGNVSAFLIENGPPERIHRAVHHARRSGFHLLAPACGLVPTTPLAHLQAFTQAARA